MYNSVYLKMLKWGVVFVRNIIEFQNHLARRYCRTEKRARDNNIIYI